MVLHELYYSKPDRGLATVDVLKTGLSLKIAVDSMGMGHTIALVAIMIKNFCASFNVSKNMTQSQIEDYAADLVLDYYKNDHTPIPWRVEEYAIFFDRAAKGEFKQKNGNSFIFDHIDRDVIENMFSVYMPERTAARWKIEDELEEKKRFQVPAPRMSGNEFEYDDNGKAHLKGPTVFDLQKDTSKDPDAIKELGPKYGK